MPAKSVFRIAMVATIFWIAASHAGADETTDSAARPTNPGAPAEGWSMDFGGAVIANPEFRGAESYNVIPVPYIDARFNDARGVKYFGSIPKGLGGYVRRDRDNRGSQNDIFISLAPGFANREFDSINGLDEFGPAAELRVGWEYAKGMWSMGATFAQAIGTGHEGAYLDLSAAWRTRLGKRSFLSVGPTLRIADSQFMSAFYSVSATESVATGLDQFEAESGLESIGLQGIISVPVTKTWQFTTVMGLSSLQGDAADTVLTDSQTQGFFLTALTRRF